MVSRGLRALAPKGRGIPRHCGQAFQGNALGREHTLIAQALIGRDIVMFNARYGLDRDCAMDVLYVTPFKG
jgi:hypothetical protein